MENSGQNSDLTVEEQCIARQRKEKKDLQAHIQQLKHAIPKGDKKKKKDVTAQVAILEAELDARHEQELLMLKTTAVMAAANTAPLIDGTSEALSRLAVQSDSAANEDTNQESSENNPRKPSKAQRRKAKKEQKNSERDDRIKDQDVLNESSARNIEAEKLRTILRSRGLLLFEIAADGNCLFSAVEDQLRQRSIESSVLSLRHQTAQYISVHRDDFLPFLVHESTGELYSDEEFVAYCQRLETTSEWGGQAEIRALSEVLKLPIEVIQADGPCVTVGEHFAATPLRLVYHRHKYGLGEHYNSARIPKTLVKDDAALS